MDDLKVQSISEVKARLKQEAKKPKSISVKMRYKDYRLIKRTEKQMERRAQDYILSPNKHEARRLKAEEKRNRKRKNNV